MADIPLIIVLDIDGTVVGDIRPQIMLYDVHMSVKAINKKINILKLSDFQEKLRSGGVIRPYFAKFVKKIIQMFPHVEIFIYTASEKTWAHFLVSQIEKSVGTKFNRPLLTRDNCVVMSNEYKKNIASVYQCIQKPLRKKYSYISLDDIKKNIIIIDNNSTVYDEHDNAHVLHCPTYDYKKIENLPSTISENVFNLYHRVIMDTLIKHINLPQNINNYNDFQKAFYPLYVQYLSTTHKHNVQESKDKFFLYFLNIIIQKNIKRFSSGTISYISRKIQHKLTS